jgi:hypothetical protein
MKWVTRDFVHLDRVACPWLIRRFIDTDAEFVFVPWGEESRRPADAIAFAIPGAELGPHDAQGTTFEKLLAKYKLDDPSLAEIQRVIPPWLHAEQGELGSADQAGVGWLARSLKLNSCSRRKR